jgi:hypothetical protein
MIFRDLMTSALFSEFFVQIIDIKIRIFKNPYCGMWATSSGPVKSFRNIFRLAQRQASAQQPARGPGHARDRPGGRQPQPLPRSAYRPPSCPAALRILPCGCWTPTKTAEASSPARVFFPLLGAKDGWSRLAKISLRRTQAEPIYTNTMTDSQS